MIILEENLKWYLEAFASELFIWALNSIINRAKTFPVCQYA